MSLQIIGWEVRAEKKDKNGKPVTKAISRVYQSKSVAEQFREFAERTGDYQKLWVSEVLKVDDIND